MCSDFHRVLVRCRRTPREHTRPDRDTLLSRRIQDQIEETRVTDDRHGESKGSHYKNGVKGVALRGEVEGVVLQEQSQRCRTVGVESKGSHYRGGR